MILTQTENGETIAALEWAFDQRQTRAKSPLASLKSVDALTSSTYTGSYRLRYESADKQACVPPCSRMEQGSFLREKELGVADLDDGQLADLYAERREQMKRAFDSLPPAGSEAYWRALSPTVPLEVLSRCVGERLTNGGRDDAEQVFSVIMRTIDGRVKAWAAKVAATVPAAQGGRFDEDLQAEYYIALWEALIRPDQGFFTEHFPTALNSVESRVAHRTMEQQGYWKRKGVTTPKRVPPHMQTSIHATRPGDDGEDELAIDVPDASAEAAFEQANRAMSTTPLGNKLSPDERAMLIDYYLLEKTYKEIAEPLRLTPDAIRHRLKGILIRLRLELADSDGLRQED